jgi:hypothetical protein
MNSTEIICVKEGSLVSAAFHAWLTHWHTFVQDVVAFLRMFNLELFEHCRR